MHRLAFRTVACSLPSSCREWMDGRANAAHTSSLAKPNMHAITSTPRVRRCRRYIVPCANTEHSVHTVRTFKCRSTSFMALFTSCARSRCIRVCCAAAAAAETSERAAILCECSSAHGHAFTSAPLPLPTSPTNPPLATHALERAPAELANPFVGRVIACGGDTRTVDIMLLRCAVWTPHLSRHRPNYVPL